MSYFITLTLTNCELALNVSRLLVTNENLDFLHPRSGTLFTIVKLVSWAVVLKVTTGICYSLKSTRFRIVSCSGAMTELTDFAFF